MKKEHNLALEVCGNIWQSNRRLFNTYLWYTGGVKTENDNSFHWGL